MFKISLHIVETAFLYILKNVSCGYSSRAGQYVLGSFINLLKVKLSFTLERAASNEYPLQTFSLRNGYPLVLNLFDPMHLAKGGHNFVTF